MPADQASPLSMRDDISDKNVADDARRRLIRLQGKAQALAPPLDREVDRIAIAPPEPIKTVRIDRDIRDHDILHNAPIVNHEGNSAIRVGDYAIVDGDIADGNRVAVAELDRAGRRGEAAIGHGDSLAGFHRPP